MESNYCGSIGIPGHRVAIMNSKEVAENFLYLLQQKAATFNNLISTENGDWSVS